jgi:hypothetical protein
MPTPATAPATWRAHKYQLPATATPCVNIIEIIDADIITGLTGTYSLLSSSLLLFYIHIISYP